MIFSTEFITPDNIELSMVACNEIEVSENKELKFNFTETNLWTAKEINSDTNLIVW